LIESVLNLKEQKQSNDEVAAALGLHPGTVKRITGGRHHLQKQGQARSLPKSSDRYATRRGFHNVKAKATPQLVGDIYCDRFWLGINPHQIGKKYGIGAPTVYAILAGTHWLHEAGLAEQPAAWRDRNPPPQGSVSGPEATLTAADLERWFADFKAGHKAATIAKGTGPKIGAALVTAALKGDLVRQRRGELPSPPEGLHETRRAAPPGRADPTTIAEAVRLRAEGLGLQAIADRLSISHDVAKRINGNKHPLQLSGKAPLSTAKRHSFSAEPRLPSPVANWRRVADSWFWVSKTGDVWSERSGQVLSQRIGTHGYAAINLSRLGGTKLLHRLVAETWLGPPPSPDRVVDHIDGDKLNNAVENLEWVTRQENTLRATRIGRKSPGGKKQFLSEEQVYEIRTRMQAGISASALSDKYKVDPTTVRNAAYGLGRCYAAMTAVPFLLPQGSPRPKAGGPRRSGPQAPVPLSEADLPSLSGEKWKRLVEADGYWVSNLGRIFSERSRRLQKPVTNGQGYLRVQLRTRTGGQNFLLHCLVAARFLPPPSRPGLVVGHLNDDPSDPRAENLAWITRRRNAGAQD
jgi:DNA-binding CsgD family transcriptional regulator